jgi:hypothetical protein
VTRPVYLDVWKLDVTPTAKLLAVRIEAYQGREGWCFASSSRLGAEIGVTGDTVRAALVELRERGCLEEEGSLEAHAAPADPWPCGHGYP